VELWNNGFFGQWHAALFRALFDIEGCSKMNIPFSKPIFQYSIIPFFLE